MDEPLDAATHIQVSTPTLAFSPRVSKAQEPVRRQALGSKLAVQALDEGVIRHVDCGAAVPGEARSG
jgi:hypothetical protein